MWFRNLRVYRLASDGNRDSQLLAAQLGKYPLTRCGSFETVARGWVFPKHEDFVHVVNKQWLLALGIEQKLLPATVIRQVTQERVTAIENEQGRKVGRKEFRDLRDAVTQELLPKAFARRRTTWAWVDPANGWLVIDAGSDSKADEFIEVFLKSVEGIELRSVQAQMSPSAAMSDWLVHGDAPVGFSIDDDLELRAASSAQSAIRYVRHGLEGKEIQQHIANGKIATKLGLTWQDKISFVLTDKLHIKRLGFLDVLKEEATQSAQDAEEQFDTDFALMAGEINLLLNDLLIALGGELQAT